MSVQYIRNEITHLIEEQNLLKKWKPEDFAAIIREVGFSCNLCGKCCTTDFNGHVFLLDIDAAYVLGHNPEYLIPAPRFELIDNEGSFYVAGYALRARPDGTCPYLNNSRCEIYQSRFAICRIYPYMLHREPDKRKKLVFRQISGLNEHGEYNHPMTVEESLMAAKDTIDYESAWISQMISFYTATEKIFLNNGFSHVRKAYDKRIQEFRKGEEIIVNVWHHENFTKKIVRFEEYQGFGWP
ncbi:MAG: YkgJ family cysteine cluster protein [Methanomicrobiales archaeon]|nr:YkgJ family cysteine cluster protein [Methanomicrobiales archaeon]